MNATQQAITTLIDSLRTPVSTEELKLLAENPLQGPEFTLPPLHLEDMEEIFAEVISSLPMLLCDFQASRLLFLCGVLIEKGAPADLIAPTLAQRTSEIFSRVRAFLEEADPDEEGIGNIWDYVAVYPDAVPAFLGANYAGLATMTALVRDKQARKAARVNENFFEDAARIQSEIPTGYYLAALLFSSDDQPIDILFPASLQGFRVSTHNIRNNFHLFTLLQSMICGQDSPLAWGQEPFDMELVRFAQGQGPMPQSQSDKAQFLYTHGGSWGLNGHAPTLPQDMIFGEETPDDIPRYQGRPVILVSEHDFERSWSLNFIAPLHGAWNAELKVLKHYSTSEVQDRLEQLLLERGE